MNIFLKHIITSHLLLVTILHCVTVNIFSNSFVIVRYRKIYDFLCEIRYYFHILLPLLLLCDPLLFLCLFTILSFDVRPSFDKLYQTALVTMFLVSYEAVQCLLARRYQRYRELCCSLILPATTSHNVDIVGNNFPSKYNRDAVAFIGAPDKYTCTPPHSHTLVCTYTFAHTHANIRTYL